MTYPPEPWDLRGQMYLSVFAVPHRILPALPPPLASTVRPVLFGGRALVGAAWVRYEPGGTLHYQELLCALLVHERGRPRVSITDIWVDSVASRDGGRALWGIPKDLARLAVRRLPTGATAAGATLHPGQPVAPTDAATRPVAAATGPGAGAADLDGVDGAGVIATATVGAGVRLPGRWPTPLAVAQALDGRVKRTGVRGRAGLRVGRARWAVAPDGPVGYLAGRRPLVSLTLADFRLRFGTGAPAGAVRS